MNGKWTVKKSGTNQELDHGDANWVDSINITSAPQSEDIPTINPGTQTSGEKEAIRDHNHTSWTAVAKDLAGNDLAIIQRTKGYPPNFKLSNWAGPSFGHSGFDACDSFCEGDCGPCTDTVGGYYNGTVNWSGKHIKEIKAECQMGEIHDAVGSPSDSTYTNVASGVAVSYQADEDHYGPQNGVITVGAWVGDHDDWGSKINCTFSYKTHDDEWHEEATHSWWWDCNYDDWTCDTHDNQGSGDHQ